MRFWLATIGEPLPTDPGGPRLLRTGMLADQLRRRGHEVVWWTSSFDHIRKTFRAAGPTTLLVDSGYRLVLLHGPGYRRNVSLRRWANHWVLERQFARWIQRWAPPNLLLCSLPSVDMARESVRYGQERTVPVVLDLRDMWPDVFLDLVPRGLQPLARAALVSSYRRLREACRGAHALTGISPDFVTWGQIAGGRPPNPIDRHFWLAAAAADPEPAAVGKAEARWAREGIVPGRVNPVVTFVGAMSRSFEMELVIEAARRLHRTGNPVRFVLCGVGDMLERWRAQAAGLSNVLFPGWVQAAEAWTLLRCSLAGIAPYRSRRDFVASVPTKTIEYLSAGLPVVSSLRGAVERLLARTGAGITYRNGDLDQLLGAIRRLLDAPDERQAMARRARSAYEREFVAERVYADMAAYLEALAAGSSRRDL